MTKKEKLEVAEIVVENLNDMLIDMMEDETIFNLGLTDEEIEDIAEYIIIKVKK